MILLAWSAQSHALDPLFATDELLELTIDAPFKEIMRDRSVTNYTPARLVHADTDGNIQEFEIGIRARGGYRRRPDICAFAPLRLNFKKSQLKNTIFDKQDKLKLVTHCQSNSPRYDQFVIKEYLAYRVLNLVTDLSYRARLVRITYIDTVSDDSAMTRLAVIIEHHNRLAKRASTKTVNIERVTFPQLEPAYTNIASMFHYFIGNTDYSPIAPSPGDDCCHNHTLFGKKGELYFSVPFDFDMSGLVDSPHAISDPRFKLHDVRQRRYRGRCFNNSHVPASVGMFFEKRDDIYALIDSQEFLTNAMRTRLTRFVDDFFASLDSPEKIQKRLVGNCT